MSGAIALFSPKGGVGKTTLAVTLAHAAARRGRRTLLWDLDAQGAASFILRGRAGTAEAREVIERRVPPAAAIVATGFGLDLLPADGSLRGLDALFDRIGKAKRLRRVLADLARGYDRVVIDCPPGLGAGADQVLRAVDLVVLPQPVAMLAERAGEALADEIARRHRGRVAVLPVATLVDRRRRAHRDAIARHPERPVVPLAAAAEQMAERRAPLAAYAPANPAAAAIEALWTAIERRLAEG